MKPWMNDAMYLYRAVPCSTDNKMNEHGSIVDIPNLVDKW